MFDRPPWTEPEPAAEAPSPDDYLRRKLMSPQWGSFIGCLASELFENFEADQACGFFRALGARLAEGRPLPKLATLQELEAAANAALDEISWGQVGLSLSGRGIIIRHRHAPELASGDPAAPHWRRGLAATLEGLYTRWLHAQGASDEMEARLKEAESESALTFRFGYRT